MNLDDAVVLETFPNRIEAEIAGGLLKSEGIESIVLADDAGGMYPIFRLTLGVRLMVYREDETRANAPGHIASPSALVRELRTAIAEARKLARRLAVGKLYLFLRVEPRRKRRGIGFFASLAQSRERQVEKRKHLG